METDAPDGQMVMALDGVSATHWDWVHRLIEDVREQEHEEHLVALWAQWRMAARQFRHVEFAVMRRGKPAATDCAFHRACLAGLMSIGEFLAMGISRSTDQDEYSRLGFSRADADATLAALRHDWEEWHGCVNPERMGPLENRIAALNAATQPH